jgi:hypothetical protein
MAKRTAMQHITIIFLVVSLSAHLCSFTILPKQSLPMTLFKDRNETVSNTPSLLLSVPFYVYEELAWTNATYGNFLIADFAAIHFKHSDDYLFMKASLQHPMRTRDPSKAKLFFIPILKNFFDDQVWFKKHRLCWNGFCQKELLAYTMNVLSNSEWFRTKPHLHVVVNSHYMSASKSWAQKRYPALFNKQLSNCNAIGFEDNRPNNPNRLVFPKTYPGRPCSRSKKTQDIAMIANMKHKDRQFICNLLWETNSTVRIAHCGQGQQCPALAQAKFGFHVPGDTFGSNRLMDTILSGTVPIFTREEQYYILPKWINWRKLSYLLPLEAEKTNETTFLGSLYVILSDVDGYREKHQTVLKNYHLFDYSTLYPFDTYMYMFQAELCPETRWNVSQSAWSVLMLPKPVSVQVREAEGERIFTVF